MICNFNIKKKWITFLFNFINKIDCKSVFPVYGKIYKVLIKSLHSKPIPNYNNDRIVDVVARCIP